MIEKNDAYWTKPDIFLEIQFCEIHKEKYLRQMDKERLNDEFGVNPEIYRELIKEAENCPECKRWTAFKTTK